MPRSSSAEPTPKQSKRKGTRSVSTLTPTQLARKRANDREAQRAIRARTKEHIERLERELADLKSIQNRDRTVQELMRRNKALEEELRRLREHMGIASSPYSAPAVYDDNLSSGSGTVNSPRMSPLPSGDYTQLPEYGQTYGALSNGCETWASSVTNPVLSSVSSPSSPGNCDDYNTTYIPTSVPATMMPAGPRVGGMDTKEIKMEYEELDNNDAGFRLSSSTMGPMPSAYVQQQAHHQHHHNHHQPTYSQQHAQPPHQRVDQWNMYPMFYQAQLDQRGPSTACVSR